MGDREEVVFRTELASDSETGSAEYGMSMHEAEVLIYPLVNALEEGKAPVEDVRKNAEQARAQPDEDSDGPSRDGK